MGSDDRKAVWLPNVVDGASVWELAARLNERDLFDGHLLVAKTEGPTDCPTSVQWELTGLVPLVKARAQWPSRTQAAFAAFVEVAVRASERIAADRGVLHVHKDALTLPALDAAYGENYYFAPSTDEIMVQNWGASRTPTSASETVGWELWPEVFRAALRAYGTASVSMLVSADDARTTDNAPTIKQAAIGAHIARDAKRVKHWWSVPLGILGAVGSVLLVTLVWQTIEGARVPAPRPIPAPIALDAAPPDASSADTFGLQEGGERDAGFDAGDALPDGATEAADAGPSSPVVTVVPLGTDTPPSGSTDIDADVTEHEAESAAPVDAPERNRDAGVRHVDAGVRHVDAGVRHVDAGAAARSPTDAGVPRSDDAGAHDTLPSAPSRHDRRHDGGTTERAL